MTLRDQPDALALIAECRRVLKDRLLPQAEGDARYQMLMIISALGMAEREVAQGAVLDEALARPASGRGMDAAGLVAAIRAGRFDGNAELHAALLQAADARMAISKPAADNSRKPHRPESIQWMSCRLRPKPGPLLRKSPPRA
jgi:hypothetical protein